MLHEQSHEAGYDAYLTAQVFLSLVAEIASQRSVIVEKTESLNPEGVTTRTTANRRCAAENEVRWDEGSFEYIGVP